MIGGVGRGRIGDAGGRGAAGLELEDAGGVPADAAGGLGAALAAGEVAADELEAWDALAAAASDVALRLAGRVRGTDEALASVAADAARARLELGTGTEALARVVRRGPRPGESPAESRLRELLARYLDLRQDVAAGMSAVAVG